MLNDFKVKFIVASKTVLQDRQSDNIDTRIKQKNNIINAYNNFIEYASYNYNSRDAENKLRYDTEIIYVKKKLQQCFEKFNVQYQLSSDKFATIDLNNIIINSIHIVDPNEINPDSDISTSETFEDTMAISNLEFLRLCGETIPNAFSGNPLHLKPFINAINLLEKMADSAELLNLLISFIKTRLHGKALESLTATEVTIEQIRNKLERNIKPENEKVIRGRMAALKADKLPAQEFCKQAEFLADSLQRALLLEGIPDAKATSMTIDETVALCKLSARSEYVKTVLASTKFASPKEVLSKFVTESDYNKNEKQIFAYRSFHKQNGFNRRYNNNNKSNGSTSNFSNFRNKPRYNGNNSNSNNSNNSNNTNNSHNSRRFQNNRRNVRVTTSENSSAPQIDQQGTHLGAQNSYEI